MIAIHSSGAPNQALYADHLMQGFAAIGKQAFATNDPVAQADIHVCIGPHFALKQNLGKRTIYIDRCLWGDDLEFVTIGWVGSDGGMIYPTGSPPDRPTPEVKPWKLGAIKKALVLLDYGPYPDAYKLAQELYQSVKLRPHPATGKDLPPLLDDLAATDVAIGYRTSALVAAVLNGVPTISLDARAPVRPVAGHDLAHIVRPDRSQWLNDMSYAQWSGSEIASGEALKYVFDNSPGN